MSGRTAWNRMRAAVATAMLVAIGACDNAPPGGGFTNGAPPPSVATDKAAMRSDLPTPNPPHQGEVLGRTENLGTTSAGVKEMPAPDAKSVGGPKAGGETQESAGSAPK